MEEKPDWIVASMQGNLSGTLADVQAKGLSARDFDMRDNPEDYWSKNDIQEAFGGDRAAFGDFYEKGKSRYLAMRKGEFDTLNFTLPPITKAAGRNNIQVGKPQMSKVNPDPWGRAYGVDMSQGGYSAKQRGWRETAINTGVKLDNGQYVKTDDFRGPAKFAVDENNSFILNENGSPFLVPVKDGEELRSNEEVYNPIANTFGAYGHDYNMWQLLTTIPKNAINFSVDTINALSEYPKAMMAMFGVEKGDESYDAISNFQTSVRSWAIPKTERGQESFFSAESIADLSQQVVWQLGAMAAGGAGVASLSRMLGAAPQAAANIGSVAGRMLMTGMAAGPIAATARDYNLSSREAGLMLGVVSAAFYPLSSLSEKVIRGVGLSSSNAAMADAIKAEGIKLMEAGFSKSSMKASMLNLRSTWKDFLYNAEKSQAGAIAGSTINESVEEMAEQAVDLGVRNLYNFYNDNIDENSGMAKWLGTRDKNQFSFDWIQEAKNFGYAGMGGAIGGAVAGKMFQSMGYRNMPQYKDIHDTVMDGQEQTLYSFIDNMEQQERLAPSWLDADNKLTQDVNLSQNKMASNILRGMVDYLVQVRDAAGITDLKKTNEDKAKGLSDLIKMSSVGKDAAALNRSILDVQAKLDQMKTAQNSSPEEIKLLTEEIELRKMQLARIVKGEFVNDYLAEALYNVNSEAATESLGFNPRSFLDGKSFVNVTKTVPQLYGEVKSQYQNDISALNERDAQASIQAPDGVTETGRTRLIGEAENTYKEALAAFGTISPEDATILSQALEGTETGLTLQNEEEDRGEFVGIMTQMRDNLPEPLRPMVDQLQAAYGDLQRMEKVVPVKPGVEPTLSSQFLNMLEPVKSTTGPVYNNSAVSIAKKLEDEQATRKDMNKTGVSLYTNTPAIQQIINSIGSRMAQVESLPYVADIINSKRMSEGDVMLPELDQKERDSLMKELKKMMMEAQLLYKESENNANSAELQVRKATAQLLNQAAETMAGIADITAGTQYTGLSKLVNQYYPQMVKAIEGQNIDDAIMAQKEFENAAFDQFSASKDSILELFSEPIDFGRYNSGNYDNYIETYNYLRGILSLRAGDFWNAYLGVISNSNPSSKVASDEQKLIVKRAVQSLAAGQYDPKFANFMSFNTDKYKFPMKHHYSVFVQGEGGTGKTSQLIPLISGIMQKIDGGQVFFTSYKDARGKKVSDLISSVRGYFSTGANTSGIAINQSNLDILGFLNSPIAVSKTNLIVFDEATLLTSNELAEVQSKVAEINNLRRGTGSMLKVLYTGDTNQNVIDVDRQNPEATPDGIYYFPKHIMDRTKPLVFSFRQTNQQLKLLSNMLKAGQFISGTVQPVQFEFNDKNEGVRVIHDQSKFLLSAKQLIDTLKLAGSLDRAVYITDKPKVEVPSDIVLSGVTVLTSEEAQSEEWDYAMIDMKDKNLYIPGKTNLVNKKSMYTAVTRARKYVLMSSPESQPFFSKRGPVATIVPLSPEQVSKERETERIRTLLGSDFTPTSVAKVNFSDIPYTIVNQDNLFPTTGSPAQTTATPGRPSEIVPEQKPIAPEITQAINNLAVKIVDGDNVFSAEELQLQQNYPQELEKTLMNQRNPVTEMGEKPSQLETKDIPSALVEQIELINKKDTVGVSTFYTADTPGMSLEEQFAIKRTIMTSPKARVATNLFLAIEKIGSPGYRNIVRNDPTRAGAYAVFIEAEYQGKRVILGVLPNQDPDDPTFSIDRIVREQGLMTGRDSVRIPIDSSILTNASNLAPYVIEVDRRDKSLGEITQSSPGVNFGKVAILTEDLPSKGGKLPMMKGEPFIPVSFTLTSAEIDIQLPKNIRNREITLIPLRSRKLSLEEIESVMSGYLNEEGKFAMSGEQAILYDSMFGHLGDTRTEPGKPAINQKQNLLGKAFRDILKNINPDTDKDYYDFIYKRALGDPDPDAVIERVAREVPDAVSSASNAKYFMRQYIERKASGKPYTLFQRAFNDLKKHPYFQQGFDFDPQISKNSSVSPAFAFAKTLPSHMYNSYLWANIGAISSPTFRLPKTELVRAISKSKPEIVEARLPAVVEDGKTLTYAKSENVDGSTDYDRMARQFTSIESPTLVDFQQAFFSGPAIELLGKAVDTFKRGMYDSIFRLRGPVPVVSKILDVTPEEEGGQTTPGAVTEYARYLESKAAMFPAKWNSILTNPDEQSHYIDTVLSNNFDFLMSLYFPSVRKTAEGYVFFSSHHKMKSYAEKDSVSLLHEGMNEMLLTQLFNTPLLSKDGANFKIIKDSNGNTRYLTRSDIEEITTEFRELTTLDEIEEALSRSVSPVVESVYYRFFSRTPVVVDGTPYWSLAATQDEQAWKIRDSLAAFFRSGEIYTMAYVDNATGYKGLPLSVFGRPNIVREQGMDSINLTLGEQKIQERQTYFFSEQLGKIDKKNEWTDKEVIDLMKGIGITWFNEKHLNDIKSNEREILGLTSPQQVNKYLMDNVVFKTLRGARGGKVNYSGDLNVVFRSISRVEGIQNSLDYINLNGDLVYRLRNTAPVFSVQARIKEVQRTPDSLLRGNMLVKGEYNIRTFFVKDGLQSTYRNREKAKSSGKLDISEQMELDIVWGFAESLKDAYSRSSSYNTAAIPFLVYGDSKTDITPIVETDDFFRSPSTIAYNTFLQNAIYYGRLEEEIINVWSQHGIVAKDLTELKKILDSSNIPVSAIENVPGMVKNLFYESKKGVASIKPELISTVRYFGNSENIESYRNRIDDQYKELLAEAKKNKVYDMLKNRIQDKSPEEILKAFHYNWFAFNESMRQLTVGNPMQYKGSDPSTEYIDMTKRARGQASTYAAPVYRRYDWAERVAKEGMTPELAYEGRKMPRYVKVAYAKDIAKPLLSFAGEGKFQEIYDGATFVTPLTRIFQSHAQGAEFGIQTPPVMKNVTSMFNPRNGVNTFIKNAEFELTPEILQNGTDAIRQVAISMLSEPFSTSEGSAYDLLVAAGASPDLSTVEYEHFEKVAEQLTAMGEQASIIMELIPNTSAKTGQGAINEFVPASGRYVTEVMDLANKGTQLDASHDPYNDMYTTLPSQLISAIGINWKEPEKVINVHSALATLARKALDDLKSLTPEAFKDKLKSIIRASVERKANISYVHSLTREDFSLDDRQVINMIFPNFNADLSDRAISFPVRGGQYVVHPADGLVQVFDVPVDTAGGMTLQTVMRSQAPEGAVGRDLRWKSPVRKDGVTLDQLVLQVHQQVTGQTDPAAIIKAYEQNPALKARRDALMQPVRQSLDSEEWTPGEAEIILPAEMRTDFGIEEGIMLSDINAEYFVKILSQKENVDKELVVPQAAMMYQAFLKRLEGNMIRIPTTAMHSSVKTKVVGFMEGSMNSVFAPSMMLFIQGADQDIDKGNYLTFETFKGKIPFVQPGTELITTSLNPEEGDIQEVPTGKLELMNPELYSKDDRERAWEIGMKNFIVQNINDIVSSPKNAYHSNVSVDAALQVLKDMRDERVASSKPFSWESYLDYARMHEQATVAKSLVGIFANSQKAYQILYALYKANGITDNNVLSDLGTPTGTETWIKLAGLINAATDDLKEQILGPLGINEMNANIVSYLATRGVELPNIIQYLDANKENLDKMKEFRRYDNHKAFRPEQVWKDAPELVQYYRLGEEFSTIAQSIMNRDLPSSTYDMFMYTNRLERFVNESFKRASENSIYPDELRTKYGNTRIDMDMFLSNEAYADNMISAYKQLIVRGENGQPRGNHAYNLLAVLKKSPHISAYVNLYKTSKDLINKTSRIIPATNKLATELSYGKGDESNLIPEKTYRDIMDYVYGHAIDKYFKEHQVEVGNFNLYELKGRTDFVYWMAGDGLAQLKAKYPSNPFINSLNVEKVSRWQYADSLQVRTFDLMNMTEEKMLELRVGLEQLERADREMLVHYSRIVNRGAMGKGSFAQLFNVDDMRGFNDFMRNLQTLEVDRLGFERFNEGIQNLAFNAIPYSSVRENTIDRENFYKKEENTTPYIDPSPSEAKMRELTQYVNSLASEEEIEEFMDEVHPDMNETDFKKLEEIATRKLRRLSGTTSRSSSQTSNYRKAGMKKFSAIVNTLKNGDADSVGGKLPINYYKAAIIDINSIYSFSRLAELRNVVWDQLRKISNETKWTLTNMIQRRFDELNSGRYNKSFKERQQGKYRGNMSFDALKNMIASIEPNQKGTLPKDLYTDIRRSIEFLGEGQREQIYELMAQVPELNPAVIERLKATVEPKKPEFQMAKKVKKDTSVPDNVVSYVNRTLKTKIPTGINFDSEVNLTDIRGYKVIMGSTFIDFVNSVKASNKLAKSDKALFNDIVTYYESVRNKKNLSSAVAERVLNC